MRTIVIATTAAGFLALFLYGADGLSWRPLFLAVGGMAAIVGLLLLAIWLQERSDAKHAAANMARIRVVERDEAQRRLWEARL